MKSILAAMVLLLLGALLTGCSNQAEASGPPEISYGRDICIECNMIISEPRFAAAYRLDDGDIKSFDGIGELVKHAQLNDEFDRVVFAWVHDFNSEDWILASDAIYVAGPEIVTPMGHGIVAFTTDSDARQFAADVGGHVMSWDEVAALPISASGLIDHHDDMDETESHDDADGHESMDGMDPTNMSDGAVSG
jgi:copper chaperone NosL